MHPIPLVLIVSGFVYILFVRLNRWRLARKWRCGAVPIVPGGFLGYRVLSETIKSRETGKYLQNQSDSFDRLGRDTLQTRVVGKSVFLTRSPENLKAVLATQFNDYSIGYRQQAFRPLLGHGIFSSEGERWKTSREMLRPQFAREQVSHVRALEPHMQNFRNYILRSEGQKVDLQSLFHELTLDASSEFLFGESLYSLRGIEHEKADVSIAEFDQSLTTVQEYTQAKLMLSEYGWLINPKAYRDGVKKIHTLVQFYVQKALDFSESDLEKHSQDGYIFLYELVKKTRDPQVLQDELLSVMLAGRSTTASLLSFLFYELTRNPEIWEKLKKEVYENFGDGDNPKLDKITFESMKRCYYLKWVINEALRCHPPVSQNLRIANKDTTLPVGGGPNESQPVFIAKGTPVALAVYCAQRLPQHYGKDSHEFRPERWESLKPGWAFMPFGSGPKICLGQQFALTEASYVTIRIAQMFPNLKADPQVHPPKKIVNSTSRLKEGLHVTFA